MDRSNKKGSGEENLYKKIKKIDSHTKQHRHLMNDRQNVKQKVKKK